MTDSDPYGINTGKARFAVQGTLSDGSAAFIGYSDRGGSGRLVWHRDESKAQRFRAHIAELVSKRYPGSIVVQVA